MSSPVSFPVVSESALESESELELAPSVEAVSSSPASPPVVPNSVGSMRSSVSPQSSQSSVHPRPLLAMLGIGVPMEQPRPQAVSVTSRAARPGRGEEERAVAIDVDMMVFPWRRGMSPTRRPTRDPLAPGDDHDPPMNPGRLVSSPIAGVPPTGDAPVDLVSGFLHRWPRGRHRPGVMARNGRRMALTPLRCLRLTRT